MSTCLLDGCASTPTAWTSFSSMRKSLCDVWTTCAYDTEAVYTLSLPTPTDTNDYYYERGPWRTYTGDSIVTVTGCPTDGYGYGAFGNHGPWGGDPYGPFWGWGYGWSSLNTITTTMTEMSDGKETVTVATVAQAVSDGETMTSIVGSDGTIYFYATETAISTATSTSSI